MKHFALKITLNAFRMPKEASEMSVMRKPETGKYLNEWYKRSVKDT